MKDTVKKLIMLVVAVIMCTGAISSQPFQGTIKFVKTIGPVTAHYIYYVKGDNIRIEELGEDGTIQGIMLVNTSANTVVALSPEREMYIDVPNKRPSKETPVYVKKTGNTKEINGYTCTEVKVSGKNDGREITYWVAKDNFDFFVPLLETLNRKDKQAVYFMNIPDVEGVFPFVGIERKTDGVELSKLKVTEMKRGNLDQEMFEIPAGYTKFERE